MFDCSKKVNQYRHRAGLAYDERYRLQPGDFESSQDYWEWRAGEPNFDAIEAAEAEGIAEFEARLREKQS